MRVDKEQRQKYYHNELLRRTNEMNDRIETHEMRMTMGNLQAYQERMIRNHLANVKAIGTLRFPRY